MPKKPITTTGQFTPGDVTGGNTVDGPNWDPNKPANPFPKKFNTPPGAPSKLGETAGTQQNGTTAEGYKGPPRNFHAWKAPVNNAAVYRNKTSTLPYKVNQLLQKGNPLLENVRTQAQEAGEARGLLNSGSNLRLEQGAVLDKAIQLTAPDAAAEQQRLGVQQQAENAGALQQQSAAYAGQEQDRAGQLTGALNSQQNASQERLQQQKNDFQKELQQMGYDAQKVQTFSTIYGNLVDSQMGAMARIMATPGQTWTQSMQDDFEKVINASKPWLASLFDIPLS